MQIKKYGGFYIGRYEAGVSVLDKSTGTFKDNVTFGESSLNGHVVGSKDSHGWVWQNTNYLARNSNMTSLLGSKYGENKANGNIVVQADAIPYYHADYYTSREMSRRLYENKSNVKSGLATGTQWDVMMKYLKDNGVVINETNCDWGNYGDASLEKLTGYYTNLVDSSIGNTNGFKNCSEIEGKKEKNSWILLTTGATEQVKKMNLYDIAGNLWEWTTEGGYKYNSEYTTEQPIPDYNTFILRGGGFSSTYYGCPVIFRDGGYACDTYTSRGFRVALYIQ